MIQHRGREDRPQEAGNQLSAARFYTLIPANHRGREKRRGKRSSRRRRKRRKRRKWKQRRRGRETGEEGRERRRRRKGRAEEGGEKWAGWAQGGWGGEAGGQNGKGQGEPVCRPFSAHRSITSWVFWTLSPMVLTPDFTSNRFFVGMTVEYFFLQKKKSKHIYASH